MSSQKYVNYKKNIYFSFIKLTVMKYFILPFVTSLLSLFSIEKISAQDLLWERSLGGRHAEYLTDMISTPDYGFILGGSSLSNSTGNKSASAKGNYDYWISKMSESGQLVWEKSYGGKGSDYLQSVVMTAEGGYILGGTSNSSKEEGIKKEDCRGGNDYWVIKTDPLGNIEWERTFGGSGQDDLTAVIRTYDGGYLLGGSSNSSMPYDNKILNDKKSKGYGGMDYWLIKLDNKGNEEWQQTYGGNYSDILKSISTTKDGGYIVGGYSNSDMGGSKSVSNYGDGGDFWILKLDEFGVIEWEQSIGGSEDDQISTIFQTSDLGYMVGGSSASGPGYSKTSGNKNGSDLWILKLDIDGAIKWQETYDIGVADILTSVIEQPDSTYLLAAYSPVGSKKQEGVTDFVGIKVNNKGDEIWRKTIGSNGDDRLCKIVETRDGGYVFAGTSNPEQYELGKKVNRRNKYNPLDKNQQIAIARDTENKINGYISEKSSQINETVSSESASVQDNLNKSVEGNNSALKAGVNLPSGQLLNPKSGGSGDLLNDLGKSMEMKGAKPGLRTSKDKKMNFGNRDYWIVKLWDKDRPEHEKTKIEALPNPATTYTNIIVGYEFNSGTASVYDLSGRLLQNFKIEDRTVPVNLSSYPVGIYIVEIVTDVSRNSIKVIKGN